MKQDVFSNFFVKIGIYSVMFVVAGFVTIHFGVVLFFLWIVFTGQF